MNIRILSPAGSIKGKVIDMGADTLRSWGHNVSVAPHAKDSYGRFAGTPDQRANDIIDALLDPDVDLLYASRGGYGCMQIIDKLPLQLIAEANKPIVGYSDITALHALWQKAGVDSMHAHMMKHLGEEPTHVTSRTIRELLDYYGSHHTWPRKHNLLFLKKASLFVAPHQGWCNEDPNPVTTEALLNELYATPPDMVGGNFAVLSGLHGTPYDFDYDGKLLFIEDIAESPYKIDRMLQQLNLCGVFGRIRGLVCGQFTGCDEDPTMPVKLWDNFRSMVECHGIPLWLGAPVGHVRENFPVVYFGKPQD